LDLLGDRGAHLVEDLVDLLAVDPHLVGERDGLRVVHEVVELVDEYEDVHACSVAPGSAVDDLFLRACNPYSGSRARLTRDPPPPPFRPSPSLSRTRPAAQLSFVPRL